MKLNRVAMMTAVMAGVLVSVAAVRGAVQAPASPDQLVSTLKQNLADSQKRLRQYEWIETTVISLKGEEKARKQQRAYYGADGKLTKVAIGEAAPPPAANRGGRGGRVRERVIENKKDEMQEYMERASALIHRYVPPDPALIQKAKDAGRMKVTPPQEGKLHVEFPDFVQPSDLMTIDVDAKALLLSALNVGTYLDKPEDKVTLDVRFGTLTDGTSYTSRTTLDAKAKSITVVIENSGHRPLGK